MPSLPHEAFLLLFKNRPELAPELLRDVLGVVLPAYAEARVESSELTEVVPAAYAADVVVLLINDKPVFGIVVEAQLAVDPRKRFTWPVYATSLRARFECPVCVLVVTPSEAVARWASAPINLGAGNSLTPFVVGPSMVPVVVDVEAAKRDPELVVLSAMAHGQEDVGSQIAVAALEACRGLDTKRALLYLDLVGISLGDIARAAFKDLMISNYEFQTEFGKKHSAELVAATAAGEAKALLTVLDARGIPVSAEEKERVLACTDLKLLEGWLRKAVTVTSADELFTG